MLKYGSIDYKRANFHLELEGTSVSYGSKVAVMGENGSGKSTFLHLLSGIIQNKDVSYDDLLLHKMPYEERAGKFAFLPQFSSVFFPFKVHEVVQFGQFVHRENLVDEEARVEDALKRMDIVHLKDREFTSLSGGEKRRVMIARVLNQNPPVFLLDEPVSMLDIRHSMEILTFLYEIEETVLASMHDINMAIKFFDRFLFLKNGKLIADVLKKEIDINLLKEVFNVEIIDNNGIYDFKL